MGINDKPGPGESVYRSGALRGEAAGEEDVEGHAFKLRESGEDEAEDTEGHGSAYRRS